ncbi:hypothetical protein [Brevundimonas faecalis]|uniref:DUF1488 family protein n=1 Tax=Brevundimonas faecalis TaxID=947378 RepID=A0ABV2R810_9CAUL
MKTKTVLRLEEGVKLERLERGGRADGCVAFRVSAPSLHVKRLYADEEAARRAFARWLAALIEKRRASTLHDRVVCDGFLQREDHASALET